MKTSIVWFKTDLRLHDNETLIKEISQSDEIIPVYCFDDAHFATTDFGFKKTGNFRAQFLLESLADLDRNLRAKGSGLLIVKGKPEVEIPKIVQHFRATKVFAKKEWRRTRHSMSPKKKPAQIERGRRAQQTDLRKEQNLRFWWAVPCVALTSKVTGTGAPAKGTQTAQQFGCPVDCSVRFHFLRPPMSVSTPSANVVTPASDQIPTAPTMPNRS